MFTRKLLYAAKFSRKCRTLVYLICQLPRQIIIRMEKICETFFFATKMASKLLLCLYSLSLSLWLFLKKEEEKMHTTPFYKDCSEEKNDQPILPSGNVSVTKNCQEWNSILSHRMIPKTFSKDQIGWSFFPLSNICQ